MKYLIWSIEHGAWWKANGMGYTQSRSEAGRYQLGEAEQICADANCYRRNNQGSEGFAAARQLKGLLR
jgi:hypothetical protein